MYQCIPVFALLGLRITNTLGVSKRNDILKLSKIYIPCSLGLHIQVVSSLRLNPGGKCPRLSKRQYVLLAQQALVPRVPDHLPIFSYCRDGNIDGVRRLIDTGEASVWDTDSRGTRPLHVGDITLSCYAFLCISL